MKKPVWSQFEESYPFFRGIFYNSFQKTRLKVLKSEEK